MELRTNCKNCGASLHYDETKYGKKVRCEYCRQEYHIDLLGRVEEYKVKLEVLGEIKEFYIGEIETQKLWYCDIGRDARGRIIATQTKPKTTLKLIEI